MSNPTISKITRTEVFFTGHLYFDIMDDKSPFEELLGGRKIADLGFEVAFFRDWAHKGLIERVETDRKSFEKQTFDLFLTLSDKSVVIIEAKAHGGFNDPQLKQLEKAQNEIKKLGYSGVDLYGIHSSKYTPSPTTNRYFKRCFTWKEIAELYKKNREIYLRANEIYKLEATPYSEKKSHPKQ